MGESGGTGRLRQDVVGELDDARTERLARFIRRAEIRGVFLAYDRILWERLREDSVDNSLCGIVAHFLFYLKRKCFALARAPGRPVQYFYLFTAHQLRGFCRP